MPLEPIPRLIGRAAREGYAVGYFESWNLESLQGVIDAAEQTRSPVIIGFNGDFLSRPTRRAAERLAWYGALGRAAAESASVPCGLIFNECPVDEWTRAAIDAGFNLVMPADPDAPFDEMMRRVMVLTRLAHSKNVAVEGELGELPCGANGGAPQGGSPTDPAAAAEFVAATGIDLLAISAGNVHIQIDGRSDLDLRRIEAIRRVVSIPLVLHGGTGISEQLLRSAIALGVAKVNYGTYLNQRYLHAGRTAAGPRAIRSSSTDRGRRVRRRSRGRSIGCPRRGARANPAPRLRGEGGRIRRGEPLVDVSMRLPDVSTTGTDVGIIRWLVAVGDRVARGQPVLEVETDKSVMEIESVVTGMLQSTAVAPGDTATVGQEIAVFDVVDPSQPEAIPGAAPTGAAEVREQYDKALLLGLYERMVAIREFEEGVKFLFLEGTMPGTIHQCQGQEATAVGVCSALKPDDFITSTFRGHGHAIAKGLSFESLLFELFGAETGCCRGKGGSMHVGDIALGMVPGIAIVAGGVPLAAGMALAFKMRKQPGVVACFFGDGAVAEGAFHEGVNLAAIWNVPAIFVCENNLYGASTRVDHVMRNPRISDRGAAYGIRGETVDGNDVLAVHEATRAAAEECRSGRGPVLFELLTYRRTGHSRRDACHYQPKSEREEWLARDPIERFGNFLIEHGTADQPALDAIRTAIQARFQQAVVKAKTEPLPAKAEVRTHVLA